MNWSVDRGNDEEEFSSSKSLGPSGRPATVRRSITREEPVLKKLFFPLVPYLNNFLGGRGLCTTINAFAKDLLRANQTERNTTRKVSLPHVLHTLPECVAIQCNDLIISTDTRTRKVLLFTRLSHW
ncbi:hypothetical protein Mal48_40890 [Thalassoglobus polymorphus]|uniref:Uncharacterized protein n=1 Tax=Thalassoglobus polymorphus TaxID=2527994 RepID=A0A517QTE4_9PLAN|nr:hypothetical protein Mal48_40890 [Thalassoglobus polymorphus]